MRIRKITCPECQKKVAVDSALYSIGSVRLRCVSCGTYFLPAG